MCPRNRIKRNLEALRDEVTAIAEVERERSNAEFAAEHPEQHATIARLMKPSSPESGA